MEFLQRHLPRVYQAVQSALEYLTNVTAQIFGAPPDAPQPRNAAARTPISSAEAAAPAQQETCQSQGADHMTLSADVSSEDAALEATEESMKIYGIQPDIENQAQERQVRHRKENVDRRLLDLHPTIGDNKVNFSHQQATIETHKDQSCNKVTIGDPKPTKPEEVDKVPSSVTRKILHVEVHTVTYEEVQKANQEEHSSFKTEEKSSTSIPDNLLTNLEFKSCQEHEVPSISNEDLKSNLNLEIKENSWSTSNMAVSGSLEKTIIIQEISEGASICQLTVTSEEVDQESPEEVLPPPDIMEGDDLDVPDIKRQHKKLVTPVSAADRSPCDQREEARKTWEHLQETAVRLALHCDLLQDDDQKFEMLGSREISKTTHIEEMYSTRPNEQEDSGEHLEKSLSDSNDLQELSSEENEQLEKISKFSKSEEDNRHDEQDQNTEKTRKRVHFSPSTEERHQIFGLTSEDTICINVDLIQDGALQPTTEYRDHPPNSHPRPEPNEKGDDFGLIRDNQDIEPSTMDPTTAEDHVNLLHTGGAIWYDELETATGEEMCESIGDMTFHSVNLGFLPDETVTAIPDKKSPKELSTDLLSAVEMQDSEGEPTKNSMSTPQDLITHSGVDSEGEYDHGEGTCYFDKADGSLEKSPEIISDHWKQDGSSFAEHEETSVSLEVKSQSSEEIKVDLLLNEDIESLKQHFHGEGDSENADSKEEPLGLWRHPLLGETKDSIKGELTSMTDELHLKGSVSILQGEADGPSETRAVVYTPDKGYNQTLVQELDISENQQLQGDIIGIESEKCLSTETSNINRLQTTEDSTADEGNEGSGKRNHPMKTETQKEEDKAGVEYEGVEDLREEEHVNEQIEEDVCVKEEHQMQKMEHCTWYTQDSHQSDDLVTYSDNEEPGSQKDQVEESSEQSPYKDSESEAMSKEAKQTEQQLSGSDKDSTKVSHVYIVSEAGSKNTSLSAYLKDALGSDNELEGICRSSETGFDLLSEIQSAITASQSEQEITEIKGKSYATHGAVSSRNMETKSTEGDFPGESNFQADNVVNNFVLHSMLMPGHQMDKISEDLADENQMPITLDEASKYQSLAGFKELDESVKGMEDGGHSNNEAIVEHREDAEDCCPDMCLSEESGSIIELKQTFEEHPYSSIVVPKAWEKEAGSINTDRKKTESVLIKETDPSLDAHCDLIPDNTMKKISESEGEAEESQSFKTVDDASRRQFRDLEANETVILLETGYPVEDINIVLGSISEPSQGEGDLFSGIHSVEATHHPTEAISFISTIGEKDTLDTSKAWDVLEESAIQVDILPDTVILDDQEMIENNISAMSHTEELGVSLELCQEREGYQHNFSSFVSTEESHIALDIVNTSEENVNVLLDNLEIIAGVLPEKITAKEHENHEESSPGHHLSEELGSLTEPKQTFEGERYSSIKVSVTETKLEVSNIGLDINTTSVEISENKEEDSQAGENKFSLTPDETSSGHLGDQSVDSVKEQEIYSDAKSLAVGNIEVIVGSVLDLYPGTLEEGGDFLPNIDPSVEASTSTVTVGESVKRMQDGGYSNNDAIVEHHEAAEELFPNVCLSEESGSIIEHQQMFEEHPSSSIVFPETQIEVADIKDDPKKTESVQMKETHASIDAHCDLIQDHTMEKISENKGEAEESQFFETLHNASGTQFRDFEVNEPVILLETGYLIEDINTILGSTSELSQGEDELFSGIQSVKATDPSEVIRFVSNTGEENTLDTSTARDILEESALRIDILPDTVIPNEQEKIQNNISAISHSEEIGFTLELSEELEENQHNSSSFISTEESHNSLDIVNTSEENVNVLLDDHENIAGVLPEKITAEEYENHEECSSGHHLSEELGSLIEPKQILKEERSSSIKGVVSETKIEVSDLGLDINSTYVEISENKKEDGQAGEYKSSITPDETLSGHLGDQSVNSVKEQDIHSDARSLAEGHIEVLMESLSDLYPGTLAGDGDLLYNMDLSVEVIASTMTAEESVKGIEDGDYSNNEAIVEHHEDAEECWPGMCLSEESGSIIGLKQSFEEHPYSPIVVLETQVEAADINNEHKKTETVVIKETNPSIDAHCDLIPDHTMEKISENEGESEESQSFEILYDASRSQFRDLEVNKTLIPLETGYLVEDINIILGSTSEPSQGEGDLVSGIYSVEARDHPTEVIRFVSITGEEDIWDTSKARDILEQSAVRVAILPDTVILGEQEKIQNNISAMSHAEELGFHLELSQELEGNKHNSSSFISTEDSHIALDIVNTSEENVNVLQDDYKPEEIDLLSEIQSLVTIDYSVEVSTITSPVKLVASDEVSEGDIFPKSITTDEKEGSEENIQELYPSLYSEELEEKLHEQDSSSATLTTGTEDIPRFDIKDSSKTTDYRLEVRLLPSVDSIQQEGTEGGSEEQLSNEEALLLDQNKHVIMIHSEEPSKLIEPPTHIDMSEEDKERSLVDRKGTLMEPSVEEDDDVDSSLLSHNTLDVSAQKSRVQLRRKTSIRRKQGQRQLASESESLEPPQPVIRPRPTGIAVFPRKMPIFAMAPAMTPVVSHPTEEQKEENQAEEEILVKPKKGIPRHAGFGIPHPQMMQELQARLKNKKPNE